MKPDRDRIKATVLLAASGLFAFKAHTDDAQQWLDRMADALTSSSYEGVVLREQDGASEALKVFRTVIDGVTRERIVSQEGNGLELVRKGDELLCVLPEKRAVLVEQWNADAALFSALPARVDTLGDEYTVSVLERSRVAGRAALKLSIAPNDGYRYGHEVWLDERTGFPLKTRTIDGDGNHVSQIRFADITLDGDIAPADLDSQYALDEFKWYPYDERDSKPESSIGWTSSGLPQGFRLEASFSETRRDKPVKRLLYSDGMSRVSVFIETLKGSPTTTRSRVGAAYSYSTAVDGHRVTAVGEVPSATVERIATSMRPAPE